MHANITALVVISMLLAPFSAAAALPNSFSNAIHQQINVTITPEKATGMWTLPINAAADPAYYFSDFKDYGSTGLMDYELKQVSDETGQLKITWDYGYKTVLSRYISNSGIKPLYLQYEVTSAITKPLAIYEFWVADGSYFNAPTLSIEYPKGWQVVSVWPKGEIAGQKISISYPLDNPYVFPTLVALTPTDIGSGNVVKKVGRYTLAGSAASVAKLEIALSQLTFLDELFKNSLGLPVPESLVIFAGDLSDADVGYEVEALAAHPNLVLYNKDTLANQTIPELQSTLIHEITHIAEMDTKLFHGATYIAPWFKEGIAVFMENRARPYIYKDLKERAVADIALNSRILTAPELKRKYEKDFDYLFDGSVFYTIGDTYAHSGVILTHLFNTAGVNGIQKLFTELQHKTSSQISPINDREVIFKAMTSATGLSSANEALVFPYKNSKTFEQDVSLLTRENYGPAEEDAVVDYIKNKIPTYMYEGSVPAIVSPPPVVTPKAPANDSQRSSACSITLVLKQGMRDSAVKGEVSRLQNFLIARGHLPSTATGYFGALTLAAVQKWQKENGLVSSGTPATTGYGMIGPRSRALFNAQCR